jgi:RimJ/RimL family protein N-acetyltransferase
MEQLDVFIKGELIDLCIPTVEYARVSSWYSMFNNPKINRFLEQGAFPTTADDEVAFFQAERSKRLILIVVDKEGNDLGVISFSFINYQKRRADIAMVLNEKPREPLAGLEAMARMVEHGFTLMGLERISAGQHKQLYKWQNLCELIGFKVEGILENNFVKGSERVNSIQLGVTIEDYKQIIANRHGLLWDSNENMIDRITRLPRPQFVKELSIFFDTVRKDYYNNIFSL